MKKVKDGRDELMHFEEILVSLVKIHTKQLLSKLKGEFPMCYIIIMSFFGLTLYMYCDLLILSRVSYRIFCWGWEAFLEKQTSL